MHTGATGMVGVGADGGWAWPLGETHKGLRADRARSRAPNLDTMPITHPRPACCCVWRGQGGREPLEEAARPESYGCHRRERSRHMHGSAVLNLMSF